MKKLSIACIPFFFSLGLACADEQTPLSGAWKLSIKYPSGAIASDIDLVVDGRVGTIEPKGFNRFNKCIGLKAPIEIVESTSESTKIRVLASKALPGCSDYFYRLALVDGKLTGGVGGDDVTTQSKNVVTGERAK